MRVVLASLASLASLAGVQAWTGSALPSAGGRSPVVVLDPAGAQGAHGLVLLLHSRCQSTLSADRCCGPPLLASAGSHLPLPNAASSNSQRTSTRCAAVAAAAAAAPPLASAPLPPRPRAAALASKSCRHACLVS